MFQNVGLIVHAPVHPITQVKTPLTIVFVVPHQAHLLPMIYIAIAITALHTNMNRCIMYVDLSTLVSVLTGSQS